MLFVLRLFVYVKLEHYKLKIRAPSFIALAWYGIVFELQPNLAARNGDVPSWANFQTNRAT